LTAATQPPQVIPLIVSVVFAASAAPALDENRSAIPAQ
jgi:hypothetical protein